MPNTYKITYFPPSAPHQTVPNSPVVLTDLQADGVAYEDGVAVFYTETDKSPHRVERLFIPLELMPIIDNQGPVVE